MEFKLNSGLMCPNYPQFQDMIKAYSLCEKYAEEGKPWVVRDEFARILEVEMVDKFARKENKKIDLRVCVTGPLELHLKNFGNNVEPDMLKNIAVSVSKFLKNIKENFKNINVKAVSIDEPTLGLNPNIVVGEEDLINAWKICVESAGDCDVQIHLHSSKDIEKVYQSNIPIIGIETAEEPKNLEMIDISDFEKYDKFLRLGIARTNIFGLAADYLENSGEDVWKTGDFNGMVNKMENSKVIGERLDKGHKIFGERIAYAGPDCGLGGWKTQESAFLLLKNTACAVNDFNKKNK
jgi:5-methyltetrahydropteroyltriglutamate--homocysteine methyltransferase